MVTGARKAAGEVVFCSREEEKRKYAEGPQQLIGSLRSNSEPSLSTGGDAVAWKKSNNRGTKPLESLIIGLQDHLKSCCYILAQPNPFLNVAAAL